MSEEVGPYRLVTKLGRGGMGTVYEATDTRNGRRVALKVLPPDVLSDPELERRFRQECELAGKIEHQHVLPVYDFDVNGRPYIAMPIIKGTDLATVIKQGPLPPERAVAIIEQMASALQAAHKDGLRHRDVKPSNIMLQPGARPGTDHAWLFDWGIAQLINITHAPVTRNGQIVGTPAYVAPERLRGQGMSDHRADVYSLAVVLYECLAGHKPFESDDDMNLLLAHLTKEPPELPEHISPELRAVVAKGLAKWPEQRYQTAPELAEAAHAAISLQATAPQPPVPSEPREPQPPPGDTAVRRPSRLPEVAAGAVGALAAVVLVLTGLVESSALVWILPVLAAAGALLTAGLRGWARTPDEPLALPGDPTRDPKAGGFP